MLHEFLAANSQELITRTLARIAARSAPQPAHEARTSGVSDVLTQLVDRLRSDAGGDAAPTENAGTVEDNAAKHGAELLKMGVSVGEVVHDYGDIRRAVTELAGEMNALIPVGELQQLDRCLDAAVAHAVTEYTVQHERAVALEGHERMGILAHELRNKLTVAMMSFSILKKGNVSIGGSTGAVLGGSLRAMRDLINNSFAQVRRDSGIQKRRRVSVSEFLAEVEIDVAMEASALGHELVIARVERGIDVEADRPILAAAVVNLLQNAFKFSHPHGHVSLKTTVTPSRVLLEIEDECGGLPPGKAEEIFRPFDQQSATRSGVGLGLALCRRGVEAMGGEIRVRDLPGKGCVFTIDLPRLPPP